MHIVILPHEVGALVVKELIFIFWVQGSIPTNNIKI